MKKINVPKRRATKMFVTVLVIIGVLVGLFFIRAFVTIAPQIKNYQSYWEKRARHNSQASRRYIALGDSTAQSVGASRPEKGYVGLIAIEIESISGELLQVVNISKSGARLQDVLDRQLPSLKELSVTSDDIVTIEIGANNMADYDAAVFRSKMSTIMDALPRQTVIATMPYFGGRQRASNPNAEHASHQIHELALTYNLRVAELYDITKSNDSWRNYAADLFHPSDRAYKFWAESFLVHIRKDI